MCAASIFLSKPPYKDFHCETDSVNIVSFYWLKSRSITMNDAAEPITIVFRIPGQWSGPKELIDRMPSGYRLTPEALIMPDRTQVELGFRDADGQFAEIFRTSCRQEATDEELAVVDNYTVNVLLSGPGGSMPAAHKMMQAAAAMVQAGGAGVFNDNSTLAHGGQGWLAMTEDGGPDAISFAFVAIVRGRTEVWTMGMHVLGLRDIVMKRDDMESQGFDIIEVIRYVCRGEKPIDNGHVLADLNGPQFQVFQQEDATSPPGSPMHNPFGRFKLVSMRDIAETN